VIGARGQPELGQAHEAFTLRRAHRNAAADARDHLGLEHFVRRRGRDGVGCLERTQRQTHARPAITLLDAEDADSHAFTDLHRVFGAFDAAPGELGNMHEALDAAEIDERAVAVEGAHGSFELGAGNDARGGFRLSRTALLLQEGPA